MPSKAVNAILQKKIEGELYDLLVKTNAQNVVMEDGTTTLAAYLSNTIGSGYITSEQMNTAINSAIDAIVSGAPTAFDTLKEIAEWVDEHEDMYGALVQSLSVKVDKEDGKGLSSNDFTDVLKSKLDGLENYIHPATHSADMIVESSTKKFVTSDEKTKIAASARVLSGSTTPADLTEQDLFIQIIE